MLKLACHLFNRIDQTRAELRDWFLRRRGEVPDAGYSTEAAIVTAILAGTALVAFGVITAKVLAKARSINLG